MNISNGKSFWTRNFIFLLISNALLFMVFEMLTPTLPLLAESLGCSPSQIGLVIGAFTISAMIARPFCSIFTNFIDKKYILFIGVLITMLSTGSYMVSTGIGILITLRLIHGFGFGIATTYYVTLASEQLPHNQIGEGMGYFGIGETICMSIGPMVGIALLNKLNFKGLFSFGAIILLIAVLLILGIDRRAVTKKKLAKSKKISYKLFEKRVLLQSFLIFLIGVVVSGVMTYLTLFAKQQGISTVAWFFFIAAITGILIRVVSGKMFDEKGPLYVLIPSAICLIIGIVLIAYSRSELQLNIAGIFYGVAFGSIFPAIQAWVLSMVPVEDREDAMSTFLSCFDIGIGGGAIFLGIIVQGTSYKTMYLSSIIFIAAFLALIIYLDKFKKVLPLTQDEKAVLTEAGE